MSRTPARHSQADIARALRAARQVGAGGVEVRPDGSMFIHLSPLHGGGKLSVEVEKDLEPDDGAVL